MGRAFELKPDVARVWLGQGRMLMVGDAGGLLDGVRGVGQFTTNEELQRHLRKGMLRTGILMGLHAFLNRFRSPQKLNGPFSSPTGRSFAPPPR